MVFGAPFRNNGATKTHPRRRERAQGVQLIFGAGRAARGGLVVAGRPVLSDKMAETRSFS
jgi:hypothetical protein